MDYLVKNGAPRVVQDIKDELYRVRAFSNFTHMEGSIDQGSGGKSLFESIIVSIVRDKSKQLVELLENPTQLESEREFARTTRDKLIGIKNVVNNGTQN